MQVDRKRCLGMLPLRDAGWLIGKARTYALRDAAGPRADDSPSTAALDPAAFARPPGIPDHARAVRRAVLRALS